MRIGLSTKITEPTSAASFVVAEEEEVQRYPITLDVRPDSLLSAGENGTFTKQDGLGFIMNVEFPRSWLNFDWTTSAPPITDPFASHRIDSSITGHDPGLGTRYYPSVIKDYLDITINIPAGTNVGSNNAFFAVLLPALSIRISENSEDIDPETQPWSAWFTKEAAQELTVTINNSGNVYGQGATGGIGDGTVDACDGHVASGGGGGGSGLKPGLGGAALAAATAGTIGPSGGLAGGAGGASGLQTATTTIRAAGAGGAGGMVFDLWNNGFWSDDNAGFDAVPVITVYNKYVDNETSGYIYGGAGGGGGGAHRSLGGAGGGMTTDELVGGQPGATGSGGVGAGAGGAGGPVFTRNTLSQFSGGSFTLINEHAESVSDSANTVVTVQGSDRLW